MTTVDEFVRTSILTYPSLYKNRTDVLHNVLCVIGTGYHWGGDGTPVYLGGRDEDRAFWTKEGAMVELENYLSTNFNNDEVREMIRPALMAAMEEEEQVVAEIDARMHQRTEVEHFYSESKEYALLHNIPAHVSADWAEACEEIKALAVEAGWSF